MSMTFADNFYTNNVDKVLGLVINTEGDFSAAAFDKKMDKLRDEELNKLWAQNKELKAILKDLITTKEDLKDWVYEMRGTIDEVIKE